jgi:hypothetical protein
MQSFMSSMINNLVINQVIKDNFSCSDYKIKFVIIFKKSNKGLKCENISFLFI